MEKDKRRLKEEYKQSARPMGVFLIRNMTNDKVFVATGIDLAGVINRHKSELAAGGHRNPKLQADWNEIGGENFAFEIVDQIEPRDDPAFDARAELALLEELWLEKLQPFGERGYNEPKRSTEEKLRRIASNRSSAD
jgi:hypothetical protein